MAKDFDVKQDLTIEEVQAYYRQQRELESMNSVRIAGKVLSVSAPEPKQKMLLNKDSNKWDIPAFDSDGNAIMKPQQYYITLAFEGGNMDIEIQKDWYDSINVGSRVLLDGSRLVDNYGNLKDKFFRYTLLV